MSVKIALAGNPNCGKTTLFNALTGSNQFVGNWPGVTVEKKEGKLKGHKDVIITDLPGIYSLSPYTLEEVVARNYLIHERPDAIINIIDGTNIERNLYLSTQIMELGIPVIMAVNMMDLVEKSGDKIHIDKLKKKLGCEVVEISALKGTGIQKAAEKAVALAESKKSVTPVHEFQEDVEAAIHAVEERLGSSVPESQKRFFAIKLLEKDDKIKEQMTNVPDVSREIKVLEDKFDDDTESIITNERYVYISSIIGLCCTKNKTKKLTTSDKIDRIVTNRWLALPIFAVIMWLVYYVSVSTVGGWATDWANDGVFGDGWHLFGIGTSSYEDAAADYSRADQIVAAVDEDSKVTSVDIVDDEDEVIETVAISDSVVADAEKIVEAGEPDPADYGVWVPGVPVVIESGLDAIGCADWLKGLILDGIVAGVGAVLGFVPQMLVLFIFLAFLEACGYMARVAFIMDRIFRKFGLSGKSFIPMLIGTGCGVPGIMASRTIENDRDRKMTIMTTTFIPCGAKLPIIALIAGALFNGASWVAPSAYFVGIAAIICSGIILKKTKLFAGDPAPFVMELPAYHMPTVSNVLRSMWERAWSFIKKAGTIILLSTIVLWFLMNFGWVDGSFGMLEAEQLNDSILSKIGSIIAPLFIPLGWGDWKMAVAAVTGLIAKENVVGTFGVLFGFAEVAENGNEVWGQLAGSMTQIAAYSFLVFNLLCAPCFAAMGAIKREMNNTKWFWTAIGYQCGLAYVVSLCIYQLGNLFTGGGFGIGTVVAILLVIGFIYLLVRPYKESTTLTVNVKTTAR
ncbi:ferrous iron transport protein B [Blautia sp. OF03-15BH]|uniref:ferrous iron transport protein B n=1 Tax=Blautia sp. OF03-15BH TaxID=2292287 RepID=UPI000E503FB0|nr:ferrous iron transport protein B [Blautia sp. OF03-15BH]RGY01262.1 ferrous iron transport protein B [Blautia sp. OF03-15BH]